MIHKWTQGFDSTIVDISNEEALLNERSEILEKSNSTKFPYLIQGVLWAARRDYGGKLPLTSQQFGSGRALPGKLSSVYQFLFMMTIFLTSEIVPIPRHLARQHATG